MSDLGSVPDAARARKGDCVARVNFSWCSESRWDVSDWDDILEIVLDVGWMFGDLESGSLPRRTEELWVGPALVTCIEVRGIMMNLNGRSDGAIGMFGLVDPVQVLRMRVGACTIQGAMITVEARLDVIECVFSCSTFYCRRVCFRAILFHFYHASRTLSEYLLRLYRQSTMILHLRVVGHEDRYLRIIIVFNLLSSI